MIEARSIHVRGIVQGVGFRPLVYRLAQSKTLVGWVRNGHEGVEIHLEGSAEALDSFVEDLEREPPAAARIAGIQVHATEVAGCHEFSILESSRTDRLSAGISPDLPVCEDCLSELFNPTDRRHRYPYINCSNCGPRYSIIQALPYDRPNTTMAAWKFDEPCAREYHDPSNRRFHAQPVSCEVCGPLYTLEVAGEPTLRGHEGITRAAGLLQGGAILAVKSLGGYHLACDAMNAGAVHALRERKFRKEKPFAIMARDLEVARRLLRLSPSAEALLLSPARPIVLAPACASLGDVAPDTLELGVMLPYTPLHHLLFADGAPETLVMTSANRSSEPIAYEDLDALERLSGIADGFLVGERPIARRMDDSIARAGACGNVILRRSRGYAPGAVASLPATRPILAMGADLKNTITLVAGGQAFMSQHIGDLGDYQALESYRRTLQDLVSMYEIDPDELLIVHDAHPEYASSKEAQALKSANVHSVQHHRAHIASVLAEVGAWDQNVIGVSFDGTGYGDDGAIWGGEIFEGSVEGGFRRVAHLRYAALPGGDAAAMHPVQAAAGFLHGIDDLPDVSANPFRFPERYFSSRALLSKDVRTFRTTSAGRLFDTAAALLGFTRAMTFEGQAAVWLEQLGRQGRGGRAYPFPFDGEELDFRPLLHAIAVDRARGRMPADIAFDFHRAVSQGLCEAIEKLGEQHGSRSVVLSGGVFQNDLLLAEMRSTLEHKKFRIWTNHLVPPNDGGISLGQAALAAFGEFHA